MKYIRLYLIFYLVILVISPKGQEMVKLYFRLEKGEYQKGVQEMGRNSKTKLLLRILTFTISCNCTKSGSIYFYHYNNSEVSGIFFEPVQSITEQQLKKISFIAFDQLIALMKKNSFADDDVDVIYKDSSGKVLNQVQ